MIHRTMVHHIFWFKEVEHQMGFEKALEITGVNVHLYGKKETKPNRKMGHITVLDDNIDIALEKAKKAKNLIKIISEEV